MKGTIKEYDPNIAMGVIIGNDKNLYKFEEQDWWDTTQPVSDQNVDFVGLSDKALAIVIEGKHPINHEHAKKY